jgi:hypothetical protein
MEIDLRNTINNTKISRKDKILIIINENKNSPKSVNDIKSLGKENGLREIEKWNISMILQSLKGLVIKVTDGWILTNEGISVLSSKNYITITPITHNYKKLLLAANSIKSDYVKEFITEAIKSLEYNLLKASVVFSWVGAMSLLYENVEKHHLKDFNIEAKKRFPKWNDAKNIDGLTKMKEYDFLQLMEYLSIIGKNTKNELENCLKLRNSCGHPSTLKIGENVVASHIEILLLNVYQKFG